MSARTTGRLSAEVCLDAGAIAGGALRKTGPAGIGPEDYGTYAARSPVQSLLALFFAPILPVSFLIPPGFLRFPFAPQNRNAYKLNKLAEDDPLRTAAEADLGKLAEKEQQELEKAGQVFSNDVLKVHREEYQKMIAQVRDGAGQIFDILTSIGKDKFQSLMDWLKGSWMSGLKTMFQNFFEQVFTGFQKGFSGIFSGIIPGGPGSSSGGFGTGAIAGIPGAMSMAGASGSYGSSITPQFQPGSVYKSGGGGTYAMDYWASLNGGSFVVPQSQSKSSSMWGSLLGSGGKGMDRGTFFGGGDNGFFGSKGSPGFLGSGTGGIGGKGVGGALGGMMMGGGMAMFMDSLTRGPGVGSFLEGIGGGALAGFGVAGPIGALVGAIGGLTSGLVSAFTGKNAYQAGSMEVSRDFGGLHMQRIRTLSLNLISPTLLTFEGRYATPSN